MSSCPIKNIYVSLRPGLDNSRRIVEIATLGRSEKSALSKSSDRMEGEGKIGGEGPRLVTEFALGEHARANVSLDSQPKPWRAASSDMQALQGSPWEPRREDAGFGTSGFRKWGGDWEGVTGKNGFGIGAGSKDAEPSMGSREGKEGVDVKGLSKSTFSQVVPGTDSSAPSGGNSAFAYGSNGPSTARGQNGWAGGLKNDQNDGEGDPQSDEEDEEDEDDDDEGSGWDDDDEEDTGRERQPITMSLNLMRALGLDTTGMTEETDWVPPTFSGVENSKPIANFRR